MKYFIIVIALIIGGCLPQRYAIETINDQFDGYIIHRVKNNFLADEERNKRDPLHLDINESLMEIIPQIYIKGNNIKAYSLIVRYTSPTWIFINDGESLVLLIDGERIGFSGDGSIEKREVLSGNKIEETAFYNTDEMTIKRISQAKSVQVKLIGKYYTTRYFAEDNIDIFKYFCLNFCKD